MSFRSAMLTGRDQFARTPADFLELLRRMYYPPGAAVWDPCPACPDFDGLAARWRRHVYCNPPFDAIPAWVDKAVDAAHAGTHSVLLVPFRGHTRYMHRAVLPHAASITVWMHRFRFEGYEHAFPAPIATLEFGASGIRPHADVDVTVVPLWSLSYPGAGYYPDTLLPDLEARYGAFDSVTHCRPGDAPAEPRLADSRNTFVCVLSSPAAALRAVASHVATTGAAACVMILPQFTARYFRDVLALVREVTLLSPSIAFVPGGPRSFMGSVVLRMGGPAHNVRGQAPTGRTIRFAAWRSHLPAGAGDKVLVA